ncbi:MAG: hypothetical protein ACP5O1_02835 [Phycisphaerae bacterium]
MIESTSKAFLDIIDPAKDQLYSLASGAGAKQAELCLQRCVREVFQRFHTQQVSPADVVAQIDLQIRASQSDAQNAAIPAVPMPAAVWARLVAAVQIDAARLGGVAEQSMLAYDPLLAPQKKKTGDDNVEGLNLSPWSRFIVAAAIVLTVGITASLILTTHSAPPSNATQPATRPASQPKGQNVPIVSPMRSKAKTSVGDPPTVPTPAARLRS